MYYTTELGYIELQPLIQQLVATYLLYVPVGRSIIIDLQSIRPQIQHLLYRAVAASHYKLVYYLLYKLQISFRLAL